MLGVIGHSRYNISAWVIIGIASVFYSYEVLLRVAPSVMKYDLMLHYGISSAKLSAITSTYYLIYAPMQLPVGMMMDRYGPRFLLTISGVICAIGIGILPLTNMVSVAILSRLLVGFGSSFAFVGVLKLGSVMLPSNRFALMSGLTLSLGMLGGVLGDLVISRLLMIETWHIVCMQAALLGGLVTVLMLVYIPSDIHHNDSQEEVDFYQILEGKLALIKNPQIWIVALIACFLYTPMTLFSEHFGIEFLQLKYRIEHVDASVLNSYIFLGWMLGGPLVCSLSDYCKSRKLIIGLGLLGSLVFCSAMLYAPIPLYWMPLLMTAFGIMNSVQILTFPIAKEIADQPYTATAVALVNMASMLSGVMQGMIGFLHDYTRFVLIKTNQLDCLDLISYRVAYITLPLFLLCAIILMVWMKETYEESPLNIEPNTSL